MTWVEIATAVGGIFGGLTGVGVVVNAFLRRRNNRAEAKKTEAEETQIITGTAMSLVNELEEAVREARTEARQAREEMRAVQAEAHELARELHSLRLAIMHPSATVESLRLLVTGTGSDGRGH